jgi:hypothetical protein
VIRNVGYLGTIAGAAPLVTMTALILGRLILAMLTLSGRDQSR